MEGNLMLERQPPVGGVGPPPRRGGPVYAPFYKGSSFGPPGSGPPPGSVTSGPAVTAQSINIPRSPRLLITPSSPDNVGPALGRLGRSIGKLILFFFHTLKIYRFTQFQNPLVGTLHPMHNLFLGTFFKAT